MDSRNLAQIYMPLLNEGTSVIRPTYGELVEKNTFIVLATHNYSSKDENWLFPPGTIVECEEEIWEGKKVLVARKIHTL